MTFASEKQLGETVATTAFVLDPKNAPRPDVAFVVKERLVGVDFDDAFPGWPDLAVEIISRTDMTYDIDDKIALCQEFETPLVWLVDPRSKLVFVYKLGERKPLVLAGDDELDGENIVPGFRLKVSTLFE